MVKNSNDIEKNPVANNALLNPVNTALLKSQSMRPALKSLSITPISDVAPSQDKAKSSAGSGTKSLLRKITLSKNDNKGGFGFGGADGMSMLSPSLADVGQIQLQNLTKKFDESNGLSGIKP